MLLNPPDGGLLATGMTAPGPGTGIAGRFSAVSTPAPLVDSCRDGAWALANAAAVTDNGVEGWYLRMACGSG